MMAGNAYAKEHRRAHIWTLRAQLDFQPSHVVDDMLCMLRMHALWAAFTSGCDHIVGAQFCGHCMCRPVAES